MDRRDFMGIIKVGSLALVGSLLVPKFVFSNSVVDNGQNGAVREKQRMELMNAVWQKAAEKRQLIEDDMDCDGDVQVLTYGATFNGENGISYRIDTHHHTRSSADIGSEISEIFDLTEFNQGKPVKAFSYETKIKDNFTPAEDSILDLSGESTLMGDITIGHFSSDLEAYAFIGPTGAYYKIWTSIYERDIGRGIFGVDSYACGKLHLPSFLLVKNEGYVPLRTVNRALDYSDHKLNQLAENLGISQRVLNVPVLTQKDIDESGAKKGTVTRLALESMLI